MSIEIGQKGYAEAIVTEDLTARHAGSGELDVFATPHMVALMERAAWTSIQPFLAVGQGSVGIAISVPTFPPLLWGGRYGPKALLLR